MLRKFSMASSAEFRGQNDSIKTLMNEVDCGYTNPLQNGPDGRNEGELLLFFALSLTRRGLRSPVSSYGSTFVHCTQEKAKTYSIAPNAAS